MIILYAIGSIYALWLMYLAVMNLSRAKEAGKLTKTALVLGMPIFLTGWREVVAAWFCFNLLNAFDPGGKHC